MSTSTANITEARHRGRAAIADKTVPSAASSGARFPRLGGRSTFVTRCSSPSEGRSREPPGAPDACYLAFELGSMGAP